MTSKALIDLPMGEMLIFYELHASYSNALEKDRPQKLYELLIYTYTKCGCGLTKALIDKYFVDNPVTKAIILTAIRHQASKKEVL